MRFKMSAPNKRWSHALLTAMVVSACHQSTTNDRSSEVKSASAAGKGGAFSLDEATAPSTVAQVQIVVMNGNGCQLTSTPVAPPAVAVSAAQPVVSTSLALYGGKPRQMGGWYHYGMFGISGSLDQILGVLFGVSAQPVAAPSQPINQPIVSTVDQPSTYSSPSSVVSSTTTTTSTTTSPTTTTTTSVPTTVSPATPTPSPSYTTTNTTIPTWTVPTVDPSTSTTTTVPTNIPTTISGSCVLANIQQAYQAGQTLTLNNIPNGSYTVLVIWEDVNGNPIEQGSGSVTIAAGATVSANIAMTNLTPANTNGTININTVQPATKMMFMGTVAENVSTCGPVQIEAQDANNSASPLNVLEALTLSSTSTTGTFYADAACTQPITAFNLAAGSTDVTVYYVDSVAGTPTLTITDPAAGGLGSATVVATIGSTTASTVSPVTTPATTTTTAGPAMKIMWTSTMLSTTINTCGALAIQTDDANSLPAPVTALTLLNLSSSSATGVFYADAACTTSMTAFNLSQGTSSTPLYYKDSAAGTPTLTITDPTNVLAAGTTTATIAN